jgi:hypothetical protein
VKLNAYLSSKIMSRISAQVVSREVKLGDFVEKGQFGYSNILQPNVLTPKFVHLFVSHQ